MSTSSTASCAQVDRQHLALIKLATSGQRAAQGQLLAIYRPSLLRSVRRQLRGQQPGGKRPSDLVQDTAERALHYFHTFQGTTDQQLKKWLFRILRSSMVQALREVGAQKRGAGDNLLLSNFDADLHPASQRGAASVLDSRLYARQIFAVMCQLPPRQRDAVRFRVLMGMTTAQLATQLDCSEDAAASLLKRGLRELHIKLRGITLGVARGRQALIERGLLDYLRRKDLGKVVAMPALLAKHTGVAEPLSELIDWLEQVQAELQAEDGD